MDAVRFLYIRYKDNVYGYVLSIVREPHEAEDVTQRRVDSCASHARHRREALRLSRCGVPTVGRRLRAPADRGLSSGRGRRRQAGHTAERENSSRR